MSEYSIKIHTHSPKAAKNLIGGMGLSDLLSDTINSVASQLNKSPFMPVSTPFSDLDESDFDMSDEVVGNNLKDIFLITKMPANEAHPKLIQCYENISNFRKSHFVKNLRLAYNSIQNATDKNNDAVKLERFASKLEDKSQGFWQVESLKAIDSCLKYANKKDTERLVVARELILMGEPEAMMVASDFIKTSFENNTAKSTTRLAYTTLATQDNEPYLLCPKGRFVGKSAVPMEVSKCRENCIDSRVDKDGTVTCAYEDWLKVSFEPQNKVLGRLDYERHPDNEANLLNLKEGERSKKLTEGEFGYEFRMTHNTQGANKVRNQDKNYEDSIEKQLHDRKTSEWGHASKDTEKRPKQAQSDTSKTVNTQLEPQRQNSKGDEFLTALLNKLNRLENEVNKTREEQLNEDGLQAHRGEMETSFSEQLNNKKSEPLVNYRDVLNKDHEEPTESVSQLLNKTAKKNEIRGLNDTLNESRKDSKGLESREEELADRRHNKNIDKTIEELLSDETENWGHQFSEEDLKHFAQELGLDSFLEDDRNEYKLES